MREPAFWHRPSSWKAHLLRPLASLYGAIAASRLRRKGIEARIPVLCVGNYHGGGAGKTPAVLALAKILRELGETPVVLSRGYGGRLHGPVMVSPSRHSAADVGDEPLMLARYVPVAVARDRVDGVALATSQGASVILMDDGFQNPAVAKDASLIVIDSDRGIGNGYVIPAGPLRAPLAPQLDRTDALIVVGGGTASTSIAATIASQPNKPVLSAHIKPDPACVARLAGQRVLAFAGIGDPGRFFRTLRARRHRRGARADLSRPSPVLGRRYRCADRGRQTRGADPGDDGKGSGAASPPRRAAGVGGSDRAVSGHARIRRWRGVADISGRPDCFGPARRDFAERRREPCHPRRRRAKLRIRSSDASTLRLERGRENAAAARRSGAHRPPADRRSSISARRAESAHRSPRIAHRFRARSRGNRRPDTAPAPRHGPKAQTCSANRLLRWSSRTWRH